MEAVLGPGGLQDVAHWAAWTVAVDEGALKYVRKPMVESVKQLQGWVQVAFRVRVAFNMLVRAGNPSYCLLHLQATVTFPMLSLQAHVLCHTHSFYTLFEQRSMLYMS